MALIFTFFSFTRFGVSWKIVFVTHTQQASAICKSTTTRRLHRIKARTAAAVEHNRKHGGKSRYYTTTLNMSRQKIKEAFAVYIEKLLYGVSDESVIK